MPPRTKQETWGKNEDKAMCCPDIDLAQVTGDRLPGKQKQPVFWFSGYDGLKGNRLNLDKN